MENYNIGIPWKTERLAIFYEHPEWFKPLFAELERRGIAYERMLAHKHSFNPAVRESPYALIVNRMSPSAHTRGHARAIPYTLEYLAYLQEIGANVLNGLEPYQYEFSKARQIGLLEKLGARYPRSRVVNHSSQIPAAAEGLDFPVVVKPNIGGSGAGIQPFDTPEALREAAFAGQVDLGIDQIALVQEYLPARDESIVRVEILDGEFLYAIRLHLSKNTFNLCPADYCDLPETGMADGVSGRNLLVESCRPLNEVIQQAKQILQAAGAEVGGVEYLVNDRDGQIYFYDINALSNFVTDALNVIGFDPFPRLVDFLLDRAGINAPEQLNT